VFPRARGHLDTQGGRGDQGLGGAPAVHRRPRTGVWRTGRRRAERHALPEAWARRDPRAGPRPAFEGGDGNRENRRRPARTLLAVPGTGPGPPGGRGVHRGPRSGRHVNGAALGHNPELLPDESNSAKDSVSGSLQDSVGPVVISARCAGSVPASLQGGSLLRGIEAKGACEGQWPSRAKRFTGGATT